MLSSIRSSQPRRCCKVWSASLSRTDDCKSSKHRSTGSNNDRLFVSLRTLAASAAMIVVLPCPGLKTGKASKFPLKTLFVGNEAINDHTISVRPVRAWMTAGRRRRSSVAYPVRACLCVRSLILPGHVFATCVRQLKLCVRKNDVLRACAKTQKYKIETKYVSQSGIPASRLADCQQRGIRKANCKDA